MLVIDVVVGAVVVTVVLVAAVTVGGGSRTLVVVTASTPTPSPKFNNVFQSCAVTKSVFEKKWVCTHQFDRRGAGRKTGPSSGRRWRR